MAPVVESPPNGKTVPGTEGSQQSEKPEIGNTLYQYFGLRETYSEVLELIGVFNPKLVNVWDRMMMRYDPDVAFALAIVRAPILNMKYTVESRDPIIRAFVEQQLKLHYRKLASAASMALHYGWQVVSKVWASEPLVVESDNKATGEVTRKNFPQAWVVKKFKAIDPRTIRLIVDPVEDEWAGVEQTALTLRPEMLKALKPKEGWPRVGPEHALLWSFRKEEVWGRLTGFPLSNQAYEPWWWKTCMQYFANRYFERRADPQYKAWAGEEVTVDGKSIPGTTFMGDRVQSLKGASAIVLPSMRDQHGKPYFDLEYLLDDKRGDMFDARIQTLGIQIMRGYWITDKAATAGDGTGSLAQAQQHADVMASTLEGIVEDWCDEVVNPQWIWPLVVANFGEAAAKESRTCVKAGGLSQSMRDLMKELMINLLTTEQMLKDGRKVTLAQRLDTVGIASSLGIPLLAPDEIEVPEPDPNNPDGNQPPIDDTQVADNLVKSGALNENPTPKKKPAGG